MIVLQVESCLLGWFFRVVLLAWLVWALVALLAPVIGGAR